MINVKFENQNKLGKICTNCVMDTTDSSIYFDTNGMCDHCINFYSKTLVSWEKSLANSDTFNKTLDRIRYYGRGKEFDCIIGMSGGIDSSYLVYLAKEVFNLRPLVFHVDAGWNTQVAVNNIECIIEKLDLDLYTHVVDWEEMKDLQLSYFKAGVPHIDTPQDHAFFATMYNFASKYNVKYILTGANYSTECVRNPVEWMYYQSDVIQLKDIHKKFGTKPLRNYPLTSILWHKLYLPFIKGIKVIMPLNHFPYIKSEAMQLLQDKFGWQPYPQKHFESRFTKFYESYWLPKKFGYDVRKVQYSSLILTGQMTREDAIEKLKQPPYNESTIHQDFEYIANKLGITIKELQTYFESPNKTYKNYASQESIYKIGSGVFKLFGLENAGKR